MAHGVYMVYGIHMVYIYKSFRDSGKPSFRFFNLKKTDSNLYIVLISYYAMSLLTVVDAKPFILSLIW